MAILVTKEHAAARAKWTALLCVARVSTRSVMLMGAMSVSVGLRPPGSVVPVAIWGTLPPPETML